MDYERALNRLCETDSKKEHIIQVAREAIEYAKKMEKRVHELERPLSSRSSELEQCYLCKRSLATEMTWFLPLHGHERDFCEECWKSYLPSSYRGYSSTPHGVEVCDHEMPDVHCNICKDGRRWRK